MVKVDVSKYKHTLYTWRQVKIMHISKYMSGDVTLYLGSGIFLRENDE